MIAAELRLQHARIAELEAQLEAIGAGGVSGPLVGQQTRDTFTAADMATAESRGFRDGVASVAASAPAPSAHIKEPYTLAAIKAKIASNDYGAELLLQHAMALLDGASLAASAGSEPVAQLASERDELFQAAIDFIRTLTGMEPPPIEVAPPDVFAPFHAFVNTVQAITNKRNSPPPEGMVAEQALRKVLSVVQRYLPPDGPTVHDAMSEIIAIVDPWPLGPLEKS